MTILDLENYPLVLQTQQFSTRRAVARSFLSAALKGDTVIETPEDVSAILGLCGVLIKGDGVKNNGFEQQELEEMQEEQRWLSSLVHRFYSDNPDEQFLV